MAGWLLVISRDTGLVRGLARVLLRARAGCQLWAVEDFQRARSRLRASRSLPAAIVLDELFVCGEPLRQATEELVWFAPLIVIARPEIQTHVALLVASGEADFVARDANYIPLALALAERALGRQQAACAQAQFAHCQQSAPAPVPEGSAQFALRLVGQILENLDIALAGRRQVPARLAKRVERAADVAFELKSSLRRLAGQPEPEPESESASRR